MKVGVLACSLICIAGMLSGCFGGGNPKGWHDPRYESLMDVGNSVFDLEHLKPARQQYRAALDRAFMANNAQAIHDAGFNLALSELRLKLFQDCLATLQHITQALTVRGWTDAQQADLHLIRASVFYEQKQWQASFAEAERAKQSLEGATQAEAYALAGLDAAELRDPSHMDDAIAFLSKSHDGRDQANMKELFIHRELMDQQWQRAADDAHTLAQIREEALHYESMRRALRMQAQALRAMGQDDAARDLLQQAVDSQKTHSTP